MLVLFETPAGYAVFKLLDEKKLNKSENLFRDFQDAEKASQIVKLVNFQKFSDTTEALAATTAMVEGKVSKPLKKLMKKIVSEEVQEQLLVADAKLGNSIKEKFDIKCMSTSAVQELMRCIRSQADSLLTGLQKREMTAMALGLAHSLSRYKLKFSPDKIDTMIVQAVCLLDDLDKELNNYIMRCREWYGWHFPELGKIVTDNLQFVKLIKKIGTREQTSSMDLLDVLSEDQEAQVKEAAEISMGTEISDEDIINIHNLCDQIIDISSYRERLYEYLKSRMTAMAPNLTILVGELVGARLISQAGSLINLAKHPASTIQILGAEKALFRALKTKKDTPKYGLIYHAALIGQASTKNKGKMSRMLAAKAALATRVDALGEDNVTFDLGAEHKVKLEARLRLLEEGGIRRLSGTGKAKAKFEKYHAKGETKPYPAAADSVLQKRKFEQSEEKPNLDDTNGEGTSSPPKKKKKKALVEEVEVKMEDVKIEDVKVEDVNGSSKKKKKKNKEVKEEPDEEEDEGEQESRSEKKKKKRKESQEEENVPEEVEDETPKKKKKKKKSKSNDDDE